jgi:modulator of FtsH protease
MAEELELWSDFNVAMLGATAALAGLVIVASSVNIGEIIKARALTARLAAGIAALVLAIIASGLGLIPTITPLWFGILLLVSTAGAGVFQVQATRAIFADDDPAAQAKLVKSVFGFLPIGAYLIAGSAVLLGHPAGLSFAAAGCLLAIVAAIVVSWVVLVEVLR